MKTSIERLNDMELLYPAIPAGDGVVPGRIYAANDANFDSAHLSQPLTEYVVGAQETGDLLAALEAIAPGIPVGRRFSYRVHETKESFQLDSDDQDIRELGGDFAQVRRTGTQTEGRTDNKGLTMVLDADEGGLDPGVQQRAVTNLRDRLLRSEIKRVDTVLDDNDTADSKNWGASATTADPDQEVLEAADTSGDARGLNPDTVVYGGGAWVKRMGALRRSDKAGGFAGASMTPEQLAEILGVRQVVRLPFRYQSSATAKAKIVGDKVWIYYAGASLMPEDPSNIKRFVTSMDGGAFRVYVEQRLKKVLVSVEHYSRIICTSTLGIRKITVTYT